MGDDLVPFGVIGAHRVGDRAIRHTLFQRGHNLGKGQGHGHATRAFHEIAQGCRMDAHLAPLEVRDARDGFRTVDHAGGPGMQGKDRGAIGLAERGVHRIAIRLCHRAHGGEIGRDGGQVHPFDCRVFGRDIASQTMRHFEYTQIQKAHHLRTLESRFGDRNGRAGDLAAGRVRQVLCPEGLFEILP